ncbi:MAG: hypothetical protein WCZ72_12170 [Gemmobacter sp.]
MAGRVMRISPRERIWLDPARIGVLYTELGGAEVQALLDRAMGELSVILAEMTGQFGRGEVAGFARNLRRMRRIADHLGLPTLTAVAGHVEDCLTRPDDIALAATWARLARNAERALAGGWDSAG